MSKAALEFLHEHGHQSLISLGCGEKLNRLDNHLKLLIGCGLNYYSLGHFAQLVSFPVRKI